MGVCVEHVTTGQLVIAEIDEQNRTNGLRLLANLSPKCIIIVIVQASNSIPSVKCYPAEGITQLVSRTQKSWLG